jgi:hypothetical protein
MSATIQDSQLSELSKRGLAIYEEKLKTILEPEYNGQVVAIHVDSGDYVVAKNSPDAMRAMHSRYPDRVDVTPAS